MNLLVIVGAVGPSEWSSQAVPLEAMSEQAEAILYLEEEEEEQTNNGEKVNITHNYNVTDKMNEWSCRWSILWQFRLHKTQISFLPLEFYNMKDWGVLSSAQ